MKIKQVIVIRRDLKMRRGKEIAQGAHASMSFLSRKAMKGESLSKVEEEWMKSSYRKICVKVNSENELFQVHKKALEAGLVSNVILDSGKTEFNSPTYTCCAIGPDYDEEIDEITGNLELY